MSYNLIYADPPWSYTQKSVGRGNKSGATDNYNTLSLSDLSKMPVQSICQENAVIFMWATTPLLPDAFKLVEAWGFKYKTMITWEKSGLLGMGNWVRVQTEFILIGIRGTVKPFGHQEKSIYKHPVCETLSKATFFQKQNSRNSE